MLLGFTVANSLVDGSIGAKGKLAEKGLMRGVHLATERTFEQDPKYAIRLLVDIAIKALSPAVNDPTTAVQALDQIEDLLRRLARHDLDAGFARAPDAVARSHRDPYPSATWEPTGLSGEPRMGNLPFWWGIGAAQKGAGSKGLKPSRHPIISFVVGILIALAIVAGMFALCSPTNNEAPAS